MQGYLSTANM